MPIIFNREGKEVSDPDAIRSYLAGQLVRPVRFDLVVNRLAKMQITDFVEIGPGRILSGLVRLGKHC